MSEKEKNKKKKNSYNAIYFFAAAILASAAVRAIIKEGRRIHAENELLAYEVW